MTDSNRTNRLKKTADQLKSRSIYLLPNLFTTAALFSGFFALISSINHQYETAAIAIFVAMVFDSLDGRVARLTHTQSPFGAEYDSLSDMVSFGVAPAILIYESSLRSLGKLGWAAAFIYCAAVALRLARFNTNLSIVDKKYFQGLPSPAGAAIIAGLVWVLSRYQFLPATGGIQQGSVYIWFVTAIVGLLMVSNVPFYSGKELNFRKSVSTSTLMILAIAIVSVAAFSRNLAEILLALFSLYALMGIALGIWRLIRPHSENSSNHLNTDKEDAS